MRVLPVTLLLLVCSIISFNCLAGVVVSPPRYALYSDFNNKIAAESIGNRGASYGEPVDLGNLTGAFVEVTPGQNRLRVSNNLSSTVARRMRWSMMGNAEIAQGEVRMSFDLIASALDKYSFNVRESATSAKSFLTVAFSTTGSITTSDANGNIATTLNAYAANVPLHVDLVFDMDARTSTIVLGGTTVASGRAFGVADGGIGSLLIGYLASSSGNTFDLDNVTISGPLPFPVALNAGFEDKTAGLPIGLGGAALNEPFSKSVSTDAIVVQATPGVNILDVSSTNTSTAQALRWQLLDNLEVRSGLFIMDFDMLMTTRDRYRVGLRERTSSSQSFLNFSFKANGTMAVDDANGTVFLSGVTYDIGHVYQYRIVFDLGAGTYDIFRDGIPLIRERVHGITARGIGAILYGIDNGADISAHLQFDSLRVYVSAGTSIPSDIEFLQEVTSAFEDQPVTPAIKVGVVNILDQPVPDGTLVTLEIASGGPPGETLIGATETTTAGVATFAALEFDSQGTYRLVARSLDAAKIGNVDIVVGPRDEIFSNGFD
ncbi:MAG: hypothetical protein ABI866_02775 [Dokdonella sp.]